MDDSEQEIESLRRELRETKAQLTATRQQLHRLLYWCNLLSRDIRNVYQSVTWQLGQRATRLILFLLRRREGVTAGDRIRRVTAEFESWRQDYLQTLGAPPDYVPWHGDTDAIHFASLRASHPTPCAYQVQPVGEDAIAVYPALAALAPKALDEMAAALAANPDAAIVYADELQDGIGGWFKPDWSPDLFHARNLLSGVVMYRKTLFEAAGGWREDFSEAAGYDLALRCVAQVKDAQVHHIPKVLCHTIQAEDTPRHVEALQAQLQDNAIVELTSTDHRRVSYPLPDPLPNVSLIIPTRDKVELLRNAVQGFLTQTAYANLEVIIVDNGSVEPATHEYFAQFAGSEQVKILRHDKPFNYSELNNLGVAQATGDVLGFMNNDLEVIHADWLQEMVSHALRPEIGAVGAKLYYPDGTLQHAGVIVGLGGLADHPFRHLPRELPGYQWLPWLTQNLSAVTGACMVMRREVFEAVGGFDADHLKVAFNDIDLCLRVREQGYRIVWTPHAELYHHESISRGVDNTPAKYFRLQREIGYMKKRWQTVLERDPYYNPNLSLDFDDYALSTVLTHIHTK